MDENHKQKMQRARELKCGKISTLAIGQRRIEECLIWILRWGFSSPSMIDTIARTASGGMASRLVRRGLVREIPVSNGGFADIPRKVIVLTKLGLTEARHLGFFDTSADYTGKINESNLRHDLLVQRLTFERCCRYVSERELISRDPKARVKQFDALWKVDSLTHLFPSTIGIEIELTPKFGRRLDEFVGKVCQELASRQVDNIRIYSDRMELLYRYKAALADGASFFEWRREAFSRKYIKHKEVNVPEGIVDAIEFILLD